MINTKVTGRLPELPDPHFHPSPTKIVRFVDKNGKVVQELPLNRAQRRKLNVCKK